MRPRREVVTIDVVREDGTSSDEKGVGTGVCDKRRVARLGCVQNSSFLTEKLLFLLIFVQFCAFSVRFPCVENAAVVAVTSEKIRPCRVYSSWTTM